MLPHVGLSDSAIKIMQVASRCSRERGEEAVTPAHVLLALLQHAPERWAAALERIGVSAAELTQEILAVLPRAESTCAKQEPRVTPSTVDLINVAREEAALEHAETVQPRHLSLAVLTDPVLASLRCSRKDRQAILRTWFLGTME
jgi:ATP-dependent Clp protease ATP-binding subunit ClpA